MRFMYIYYLVYTQTGATPVVHKKMDISRQQSIILGFRQPRTTIPGYESWDMILY